MRPESLKKQVWEEVFRSHQKMFWFRVKDRDNNCFIIVYRFFVLKKNLKTQDI